MFDSENPGNSQVADGIANILKRVRTVGPAVNATAKGAGAVQDGTVSLQDGLQEMLRRNRMYGPIPDSGQEQMQKPGRPPYLPPIQTKDDQGKTIPKYRMGTRQRILGTLANFANGFAGHGGSPVYVGPGALNNRYYRDEAYREQQNKEAIQHNADGYRNAIDYHTIVQDAVTGKWKGKTYGGEVRELDPPPWAGAAGEDQQPNNKDMPVEQPDEEEPERYVSTPARRRFAETRRQRRGY